MDLTLLHLVSFILVWCESFCFFCTFVISSFLFYTESLIFGNGLHTVLEMSSQLIQSGKVVFIDQNTKLKVYTFSPPNIVGSGKLFFTANMSEFLKESKSVVEIKNDKNNMCFAFLCLYFWTHSSQRRSNDVPKLCQT